MLLTIAKVGEIGSRLTLLGKEGHAALWFPGSCESGEDHP